MTCAFLLDRPLGPSSEDPLSDVRGLMIQAKDVEKGEYTRLGYFRVWTSRLERGFGV